MSPHAAVPAQSGLLLSPADEKGKLLSTAFTEFLGLLSPLNESVVVLAIGVAFAISTFGYVCHTAVVQYRSRDPADRSGWTLVALLLSLNMMQMISALHPICIGLLGRFQRVPSQYLDRDWGVMYEISISTMTALVAQIYFAYCFLTGRRLLSGQLCWTIVLFVMMLLHFFFIMPMSAVLLFWHGYATAMKSLDGYWPICISFAFSMVVDMTLAYALQDTYGEATTQAELEYWAFKSLAGCGLISLFALIVLVVMKLPLVWLMITFVLGSLYTRSVLESINTLPRTRFTRAPYPSDPLEFHSDAVSARSFLRHEEPPAYS